MDAIEEAQDIRLRMPDRQTGRTRAMLETVQAGPPRTTIVVHTQDMARYLTAMIKGQFPQLIPWVNIYPISSVDRLHGIERLKVDHAVLDFAAATNSNWENFQRLREFARVIALREQAKGTNPTGEIDL